MKKRRKNPSGIRLIVRLCCFFVFVSSLHTQATVWAQGKVTVELQNKTLGEVLKVLKEQTGVHFMYNTQEVNVGTKVSVSLNEARLEEALQSIFQGLPYRYNQVEDYILITPKKESETQSICGGKKYNSRSSNGYRGKIRDPFEFERRDLSVFFCGNAYTGSESE